MNKDCFQGFWYWNRLPKNRLICSDLIRFDFLSDLHPLFFILHARDLVEFCHALRLFSAYKPEGANE